MGCYKELVDQMISDGELLGKIMQIRDSKKRGEFDPITVKQDFRLIEMDEITNVLSQNWIVNCKEKIEEEDDFRGIRVIDKKLLIIEIDKFDRHTLTEKYQRERKIEFHRLLIGDRPFDETEFFLELNIKFGEIQLSEIGFIKLLN